MTDESHEAEARLHDMPARDWSPVTLTIALEKWQVDILTHAPMRGYEGENDTVAKPTYLIDYFCFNTIVQAHFAQKEDVADRDEIPF